MLDVVDPSGRPGGHGVRTSSVSVAAPHGMKPCGRTPVNVDFGRPPRQPVAEAL
jgi:hypothetical protein